MAKSYYDTDQIYEHQHCQCHNQTQNVNQYRSNQCELEREPGRTANSAVGEEVNVIPPAYPIIFTVTPEIREAVDESPYEWYCIEAEEQQQYRYGDHHECAISLILALHA